MSTIQYIPLHQLHEELGAKITDFAGFYMPVRYSSDKEEHQCVRERVGVFDVSHMGEFMLYGPKALDLIQKVTSNDASKLTDGKAQYSALLHDHGGIVDDLLVYRLAENEYMLVVNASNIEKDWQHIQGFNTEGVEMKNISTETCLFAVQGPKAQEVLQTLTEIDLSQIAYYSFVKGPIAGIEDVIISSTGYTGAGGFELYVHKDKAIDLWKKIFDAGKAHHIQPIGLGARDTLRLEMGFCLYGNDIDDSTTPLEAGLGWITKFTKDFRASEALSRQKEEGLKKKLVGFEMIDKGIPRGGYEITDHAGNNIGKVTSGTISPSLNIGIGLGYVNPSFSTVGQEIIISIRDKGFKARIVKLPFWKGQS